MPSCTTSNAGDPAAAPHPTSAADPLGQFFSLQENLNACLTVALKKLEDRFAPYPALRPSWHALKAFLRKRGKRIRPMLFLFSYQLFDDQAETPPMAAFRVATALEIFHAFALIHDDIIDASDSRRGAPTLHKRLQFEADIDDRDAENLAIVLGDILFGFAMEGFLDHGFEPARAVRALRFFLKVAQDTGLGQAVEIAHLGEGLDSISEEEILQTYFLKTTRYTIESPLMLGAILSGAGHRIERTLGDFAQPLGLAFQIENDLHEIESLTDSDQALAYDLKAGVKTLFLKKLYLELPPTQQVGMTTLLQDGDTRELATLMRTPAARRIASELRTEVTRCYKEARRALRTPALSPTQRERLLNFIEFISLNSHHSEAPTTKAASA